MNITFKKSTKSNDLKEVVIENRLYTPGSEIRSLMDRDIVYEIIVAYDDKIPVGVATLSKHCTFGSYTHYINLWIKPSYRKKGIGSSLAVAIIGKKKYRIHGHYNPKVRGIYKSLGLNGGYFGE